MNRTSAQFWAHNKKRGKFMSFDEKKVTSEIMNAIGGKENVNSVTHCVTRLRFNLKDKQKVNNENLKKIEGVLDVVYAAGQCQVILGPNLIPVYDCVVNDYNLSEEEVVDENHIEDLEPKNDKNGKKGFRYYLDVVIQFLSSSLAPFITVLYGAGMLRVVIVLAAYFFPAVSKNSTYIMFNYMSQVPFYFMVGAYRFSVKWLWTNV